MTAKIIVTLGGDVGAPEVDYTATSPFFEAGEGESAQWSFETTFANGDDGQGEFVVDNDSGEIPRSDGTRNLAAKNPVRLTEDASGTDYTLVYGRILEKDVTRNEDYPIADASQYRVTVQAPGDLALMKLTEDWVRPIESDYDRLVALQAYLLNGSASTAPKIWNTVDITVDSTHLAPNTNTVAMPAHTYQAGTALDEIIEDIRTMSGKTWGIVPHHVDGVGSHKCLQIVLENDNTTNPCTIKISDVLADLDPDGLSGPPVIAPQWGAPRHEEGEQQTFGLVVRYGPDDKYVYVEGPHVASDIASYDRAVDTIYDDQSETAAQATARGLALIEYKRFEHVTHTAILKVRADHAHLIAPGMSIDIKSSAAMSGAYLHTWQTRRIASVQYEPLAPEAGGDFAYYQLTLELDRRLRREPPPRSNAKPGPQPPSGSCTDVTADHADEGQFNGEDTAPDGVHWNAYLGSGFTNLGQHSGDGNWYASGWSDFSFGGTFVAGTPYTFGLWTKDTGTSGSYPIRVGRTAGVGGEIAQRLFTGDSALLTVGPDADWTYHEITWTPAATFTSTADNSVDGVKIQFNDNADSTVFSVDDISIQSCTDAEAPPASDDTTGDPGSDTGCYSPCDHKHPVQTAAVTPITDAAGDFTATNVEDALAELQADAEADDAALTAHTGDATDAHDASAISIADSGGYFTGTDVEAALQELGAGGGGSALTVEEVDGSPTDSAVTKIIFPNGTLAIASHEATYTPATGGGGSGNVVASPSGSTITIPGLAVPDREAGGADDDEFDQATSGVPSGWTSLGTPDTVNTTDAASHLHLVALAEAAVDLKGIYKAAPSFPFTVTTHLRAHQIPRGGAGASSHYTGLFLGETTPGVILLGIFYTSAIDRVQLALYKFSSPTGTISGPFGAETVFAAGFCPPEIYLRLTAASTTSVTYEYSFDGLIWWTVASAQNPSMTIGSVGFAITAHNSGGDASAYLDWIRFT